MHIMVLDSVLRKLGLVTKGNKVGKRATIEGIHRIEKEPGIGPKALELL